MKYQYNHVTYCNWFKSDDLSSLLRIKRNVSINRIKSEVKKGYEELFKVDISGFERDITSFVDEFNYYVMNLSKYVTIDEFLTAYDNKITEAIELVRLQLERLKEVYKDDIFNILELNYMRLNLMLNRWGRIHTSNVYISLSIKDEMRAVYSFKNINSSTYYDTLNSFIYLFKTDNVDEYVNIIVKKDNAKYCADCGELLELTDDSGYVLYEDEMHFIDDELYCDDCVFYCEHCESYQLTTHGSNYARDRNDYEIEICDDCRINRTIACYECDTLYLLDSDGLPLQGAYYDGEYYCSDCYDELDCNDYNVIGGYHTALNNGYSKCLNDDYKYTIGFELEVDSNNSNQEVLATALKVKEALNGFGYSIEQDGSLDNGFEIVSPILCDTNVLWRDEIRIAMEILKDDYFTANDNDTCGLHIHISKEHINADTFIKSHLFLNDFTKDIYKLFRRVKPTNYALSSMKYYGTSSKPSYSVLCDNISYDNSPHYLAISATSKNTIEFRIPKSTLNFVSFNATIELTMLLFEFVKQTPHNVTLFEKTNFHYKASDFVDFIKENASNEAISYYNSRVKKHKIFNNKLINTEDKK